MLIKNYYHQLGQQHGYRDTLKADALIAGAPPEVQSFIKPLQQAMESMRQNKDRLPSLFSNGRGQYPDLNLNPQQALRQAESMVLEWQKPFLNFPRRYLNASGQEAYSRVSQGFFEILHFIADNRQQRFYDPAFLDSVRKPLEAAYQKARSLRSSRRKEDDPELIALGQQIADLTAQWVKMAEQRYQDFQYQEGRIDNIIQNVFDMLMNIQTDDVQYVAALKTLRAAVLNALTAMDRFNQQVLKNKKPDFKQISLNMKTLAGELSGAADVATSYLRNAETRTSMDYVPAMVRQVKKVSEEIVSLAGDLPLTAAQWAKTPYGQQILRHLEQGKELGATDPELAGWKPGDSNPWHLLWQKTYAKTVAPLRSLSRELSRLYKGQ